MERKRYHPSTARAAAFASEAFYSAEMSERFRNLREMEKPAIYWVKLEDVSEDIFDKVLGIYESVYNKNGKEIIRPNVSELSEALSPKGMGYIDWDLMGHNTARLEARRRIGAEGVLYVRFRTMPGGSMKMDDTPNLRRDEFQFKVDALLLENNLAVKLEDTF